MEEQEKDNFEKEAIEKLKNGKDLGGKDGVLGPMLKRLLEASMESEVDAHLSKEDTPNSRMT
jgi:putative transposase